LWEKENETPLNDLAVNYLNPILKDFHLEVKTELSSLKEIEQINLANKETLEIIPQQFWSTGIKNIIARTIPLYTHKFEKSIICIDEPETSLYPDIQRKIIDIYSRLAPNNQFFYATHSPIIASSFEPWEIVELKFDDEGYVYREQYWEGENHVDNYKYDPRYLRWDSILQNIFDLENDGSDERKKLLQEFSNLDNKLKERKRKGDKLSKEDPEVQELMKWGKQLGWDIKQGKA
jgi:AAA15 family ATPase/GTPase